MRWQWKRRWRRWGPDALVLLGAALVPVSFSLSSMLLAAGLLGLFQRLTDHLRAIEERLERIDAAIPNFDVNGNIIPG